MLVTNKCTSHPLLPLQHLDAPWDQKKEAAEVESVRWIFLLQMYTVTRPRQPAYLSLAMLGGSARVYSNRVLTNLRTSGLG
jgi:hypothetical protein